LGILLWELLSLRRLLRKLLWMCNRGGGRGSVEKVWRVMHALLLCENALKAVWLTCIKLGLILREPLLHRLLHLLSLIKLRLSLVHLCHLSLLLQYALLFAGRKGGG
jgi:hypothetical protein